MRRYVSTFNSYRRLYSMLEKWSKRLIWDYELYSNNFVTNKLWAYCVYNQWGNRWYVFNTISMSIYFLCYGVMVYSRCQYDSEAPFLYPPTTNDQSPKTVGFWGNALIPTSNQRTSPQDSAVPSASYQGIIHSSCNTNYLLTNSYAYELVDR